MEMPKLQQKNTNLGMDEGMTPQEIMNGMQKKNQQLSAKNDELPELAESMAQAERDYNVAYAKKLLELKSDGMAISLAKEIAKGDKVIADLLFAYRVAEAVYDSCKKKIASLNTAIDTYRSLLSWQKSELERA
jgi:hypothetical protein